MEILRYKQKNWVLQTSFLFLWLTAIGVLAWLVWINWNAGLPYLLRASHTGLTGALLAYMFALFAVITGWCVIMHPLTNTLSWWMHVRIYCATLAARRLPGTLWYIGGRIALYQRVGVSVRVISLASGIEYLVTLVAGAVVGIAFVTDIPLVARLLSLFAAVASILLFYPIVIRLLKQRFRSSEKIPSAKRILAYLSVYGGMWMLSGIMLGQLISAFQLLTLEQTYRVIGVWSISGTVGLLTLFLPSSFGVTELTLVVLLSQTTALPLATVVAILSRLFTTFLEIILSVVFYPILKKSNDWS